ncbi:lysine--tRNA ligase [Snodgrassella communis]|uniref:lysine--tRNA ligase n=1 Tax=Snodgrassella communis TaxID=2946699 RepID=UPI000C1F332A|nr:lysine--tRNA ligase [Snodgrassella communis]PIT23724.1 lysine--tRNA ligase [Snodgrassella communis]
MSEQHNAPVGGAHEEQLDENQIMANRRDKLTAIRTQGIAFPNDFKRDAFAGDLHEQYEQFDKDVLAEKAIPVKVAGRIMLKRHMGKASFATIQDLTGRIQLYINNQSVGEQAHDAFKHWDLGDIVGAEGELMKTNHGELTVRVSTLRLLTKSLRPLPDKFHGLADQEQKYRQRYVDLITNEQTRDTFVKRSRIIQAVRNVMVSERYLEVETPMMHPIPGGATAKPFVTHHNALDMDLFLRVAPELYLKRLVVGGLERVFEINRNFRNEGMSTRHNPEFTMMEFYEAYGDYQRMMDMTEQVIRAAAIAATGSAVVSYNGREVDLSQPFARMTIVEAIKHFNPQYADEQLADDVWLKSEIKKLGGTLPVAQGLGSLQLALFEECAEAQLWQPTFIVDYPVEVSPLARASDIKPGLTERFELFVVGRELANGYSELNDPEDQAARFREQVAQLDAGDDEAMHYDADYIRAMEYGLPPTGGCGIGMDRLVMLLTDAQTIRDVILFPQMRLE